MPACPKPVRRERASRLRDAGANAAARFHAGRVGSVASVLAESERTGHSEHFCPVRLHDAAPGALIQARIIDADAAGLVGRPV